MPADPKQLAKLTVAALRERAKRDIGAGTSKLRTKAQLIEALLAVGEVPAAKPKVVAKAKGKSPPAQGLAPLPEVAKAKFAAKAKGKSPPAQGLAPLPKVAKAKVAAKVKGRSSPARGLAPLPEVAKAKVKGRSSPAEGPAPLAPVPVQALPLDGQTLLVRWGAVALAEKGERWEVELSTEGGPTRTIPVRIRTRQTYLRALPPGTIYRAALVARSADGARRVIGTASRPVVLFPPVELAVPAGRFVRYSWADPLTSAASSAVESPGGELLAGGGASEAAPGVPAEAFEEGQPQFSTTGSVTSRGGSFAGAPIGWLLGPRPTSFAN